MLDNKNKFQQGIAVYLAITIMTILLAIAFGLSAIFLGQTKMVKEMGNSVIAFYAADAGIEKVLLDRTNPNLTPDFYSDSLANGATYQVLVSFGGVGDCPAQNNYCITSIGTYQETRRAVGIKY